MCGLYRDYGTDGRLTGVTVGAVELREMSGKIDVYAGNE